ncbi:MAG: C-GCAxxG-C-C family protein [bacterium]
MATAVSGFFGAGEDDEAKERSYERAAYVVGAFRERFGTILCREVIDLDLNEQEGRETYQPKNIRDKYCVDYVTAAVKAAYEAIAS